MKMNSNADNLMREINQEFPVIEMPKSDEIPHHRAGCVTCEHLAADLAVFRDKTIDAKLIRELHQEMSHLSAKAWRWMLPFYLRYCLTSEAEYSRFETEFLIYSLAPTEEFEADTSGRLSLISVDQLQVLLKFLSYLLSIEYWKSYCPTELYRGIAFLMKTLEERSRKA